MSINPINQTPQKTISYSQEMMLYLTSLADTEHFLSENTAKQKEIEDKADKDFINLLNNPNLTSEQRQEVLNLISGLNNSLDVTLKTLKYVLDEHRKDQKDATQSSGSTGLKDDSHQPAHSKQADSKSSTTLI